VVPEQGRPPCQQPKKESELPSGKPAVLEVGFRFKPSRLQITIGGKDFATYV